MAQAQHMGMLPKEAERMHLPWLVAALLECGQLGDGAFACHAQHVSHQSLQRNPSKPALCVKRRKHILESPV